MEKADLREVRQVLVAFGEEPYPGEGQVIPDHKSKVNSFITDSSVNSGHLSFCVASLMVAKAMSILRSGCFKVSSKAEQ